MKKTNLLIIVLLVSWDFLYSQTLYQESFEGTLSVTQSGTPGWAINTTYYDQGSKSYRGTFDIDSTIEFHTASFSTSGEDFIKLSFSHIAKLKVFDYAHIYISIDSGSNWTQLTHSNCAYMSTVATSEAVWNAHDGFFASSYPVDWVASTDTATPYNSWWKREIFDISSLVANESSVMVKFEVSDNGNNGMMSNYGWLVDSITVEAMSCEFIPPEYGVVTAPEGDVYTPGPYPVTIFLSDDTGIDDAILSYSVNGGSVIQLNMSSIGSDLYTASIPSISLNDTVGYTITAHDTSCYEFPVFDSLWFTYLVAPIDTPEISACVSSFLPYSSDTTCLTAFDLCSPVHVQHSFEVCVNTKFYYKFYMRQADSLGLTAEVVLNSSDYKFSSVNLYGPFDCEANFSTVCGSLTGNTPVYTASNCTAFNISDVITKGYYILVIVPNQCVGCFDIDFLYSTPACDCTPCEDCLGSFAPEPGKKYVLSAWVRENIPAHNITTYTDPAITITFSPSGSVGPFSPEGQIIDGWQRLEESFVIPGGSTELTLKLLSLGDADVFFDDIRIFPFDGSMKSYVYDSVNLRFVAELDENNYATFFEYDEEGKRTRLKKETEKGIMTISESRSSKIKK